MMELNSFVVNVSHQSQAFGPLVSLQLQGSSTHGAHCAGQDREARKQEARRKLQKSPFHNEFVEETGLAPVAAQGLQEDLNMDDLYS